MDAKKPLSEQAERAPWVWLVVEEHDYGSSDPVGAFSTEAAAHAWISQERYHEGAFVVYPLEVDAVRPHWDS